MPARASPHGATFVVRAPPGVHRFQRHFHEDYGLCVNLEGGGTFHCEGGPYSPLPGALVLTNPGGDSSRSGGY